jgi:hypothetical protein
MKKARNKNFNLTGTAIGEFEFSVLAKRLLKYFNTARRMFQQVKLALSPSTTPIKETTPPPK